MPARFNRRALLPSGSAEHQIGETSLASEPCFSALSVTGEQAGFVIAEIEVTEIAGKYKFEFDELNAGGENRRRYQIRYLSQNGGGSTPNARRYT
jgi:hypothetical protein